MNNSNEVQRLKERLEFLKSIENERVEHLEHLRDIAEDEQLKSGIEKVIKNKKYSDDVNDWGKAMQRFNENL